MELRMEEFYHTMGSSRIKRKKYIIDIIHKGEDKLTHKSLAINLSK